MQENIRRNFENQIKTEHDSFRENFRQVQGKIKMLENEAHLYSDKLD
jgi:hypothetical protein